MEVETISTRAVVARAEQTACRVSREVGASYALLGRVLGTSRQYVARVIAGE